MINANRQTPEPVLQIVYVSEARWLLAEAEIARLANAARYENATLGISGILLYRSGRFYGVSEGPKLALLALMERVMCDRRHRELRVLREEEVIERRFTNWTFGSVPLSTEPAATADGAVEFILRLSKGVW